MPERKLFFLLISSQRDWTQNLVRSAFLMVLLFWRKEPVYGVLLAELPEEPHVMTQDEELEPLVVAAPAKYTRQVVSFGRDLAKLFFYRSELKRRYMRLLLGSLFLIALIIVGPHVSRATNGYTQLPQAVVEFWRELSSIF